MTVSEFKTQDGYGCPTCEKTLATSLGLKQHHTKVHGDSLVEKQTCVVCGDKFDVRPSHDSRHTCSRECKNERRRGRDMPARERQVEKECPTCGDTFSVKRSVADVRVHCSQECYQNSREGEMVACERCGDEFYAYDSYASDARFCSQDCYGDHLSENRSGKQSPHWKGEDRLTEKPPYGPGWTERKREHVRERDGRECQRCGLSEAPHVNQHGCKLHVHHEVDPRESQNPAVHNAPRNLTTLCVSCHFSVTHG